MKVITQDSQLLNNFAMILELTDVELAYIEEHGIGAFTIESMQRFMKSKGNNAHIMQLTINDVQGFIQTNMQVLLTKYDTVSWFNPKYEFYIRRAKCQSFSLS